MDWRKEYEKLGFRANDHGRGMHMGGNGATFHAQENVSTATNSVITVTGFLCDGLTIQSASLASDPLRAWELMRDRVQHIASIVQLISDAITPKTIRHVDGEVSRHSHRGLADPSIRGNTTIETLTAAMRPRGEHGMRTDE